MTAASQARGATQRRRHFLFNFIGALMAGLVGFGFIHSQDPIFQVPEKDHVKNLGESQEKWSRFLEQQRRVDRLNASVNFAVLGGALAVAMVLGNSTCCSVPVRVLAGIPLGALAGAAAGLIGSITHQAIAPISVQPGVVDTVKVQVVLFASLGIGLGLVSGLPGRSFRSILGGVVAGALGGVLAGMALPIVASLVIPSASIDALIPPKTPIRLLWLGIGTGLLGLIIPVGVGLNACRTTPMEA